MQLNLIEWHCRSFAEINVPELYKVLQLRTEVFVVGQNCVYQDMDGKDYTSFHLFALDNDKAAACTRLLPPGLSFAEQSIGRVAVALSHRELGLGRELVKRSIDASYKLFGKNPIRIGAQLYLTKFYESLGFEQRSDVYDEDGIPHIEMVKAG